MGNVKIDNLASEIMKGLTEYKDLDSCKKSWSYSKTGHPSECSKENRGLLKDLDC